MSTWLTASSTARMRPYPDGHFDIYTGDAFERVLADQLDFLARHVPVG